MGGKAVVITMSLSHAQPCALIIKRQIVSIYYVHHCPYVGIGGLKLQPNRSQNVSGTKFLLYQLKAVK